MSFKITKPGEYKTRDGRKVVVKHYDEAISFWVGDIGGDKDKCFSSDGRHWCEPHSDIVGYWQEETPTMSLGFKKDDGKPKASLLPLTALMEVTSGFTRAMAPGSKYPEHNFRHGMAWTRPANAGFRHLVAWLNGQDNDSESGDNHLAAAIASLMMVLEMQLTNIGTDDRWPKVVEEQKNVRT